MKFIHLFFDQLVIIRSTDVGVDLCAQSLSNTDSAFWVIDVIGYDYAPRRDTFADKFRR